MAGDTGTGGTVDPPCTEPPCLVDDLSQGKQSYKNPPFVGGWDRYIQPDGVWAETATRDMIQERSDEAGNLAFHVVATGLDDWGMGVFITLNGGSAFDIGEYTALSFDVRSAGTELSLAVAFADQHSHRPACQTPDDSECDQHVRYETFVVMSNTWTTVTLNIADFIDLGNQGRVSDLDEGRVYAIHFQMDPAADIDGADFWIDDIYFE
jgi:hypothetical protein